MIRFHSYRRKKSYILTIILILLAIFLSFSGFRNLFGVRSAFQAVIYPFQFVAVTVWKGVTGIPSSIANLWDLSKKNAENNKKIAALKTELLILSELKKENERLRDLLGFKQNNPYHYRLLPAQVIGKVPSPWFSILEINRGESAGVKKGMPAITDKGLAGQVIETSKFSSKIMLLIDPESSVASISSRSRDLGIVAGGHSSKLSMKYVAAGGDVKEGDRIVTSQISTTFPPWIPIGTVAKASKGEHDLFYHIEVKPFVDFSKIEELFVIY